MFFKIERTELRDILRICTAVTCFFIAAQSYLAANTSQNRLALLQSPDFDGFQSGPIRVDLTTFQPQQREQMKGLLKSQLISEIERLEYERRIQTFRGTLAITGVVLCWIGRDLLRTIFPE